MHKTNKLSHTLMVGEDSLYCDELSFALVKSIFCLKIIIKNSTTVENVKLCLLEHNNYVDFYIIESETSIKKRRDSKL